MALKNKGIRLRKKELGPMISNFLFYEDDASLQEKYDYVQLKLEIRELLKDDFNRKVLVEILLDLQKDISGDARKRLFELYKNLGLHLDAFEKLKSWRWEIISKGILELTQLQVEESYGFIKKFVNHRRGVIRKQAQMATVSLKHEGIAYFLDTCKYRISEWQQLKLLDEIRNLEDFQPPRFKAWLTSRNKDVVLFSLRLIKYYKQNDANDSLVELVKHKNEQIKIEAINCIKEFLVFDAVDTLKAVFWKCSPAVKLALLDTIASLGEDKEIPFLQMVGEKESNFMVKSKVLGAINTISPETVLPTHGIEAVPDYDTSQEILKESPGQHAGEPKDQALRLTPEPTQNTLRDMAPEKEEGLASDPDVKKLNEETEEESAIGQIPLCQSEPEVPEFEWDMAPNTDEEIPNDQQLDEILPKIAASAEFPIDEIQYEPKTNDPKDVVMENKENIEWDEEAVFKMNLEGDLQQQSDNLNSEEAYWDAVLDPGHEDEDIFELCFMEELEEILSEADRPQESWSPQEVLPLNFLPIIENEADAQAKSDKVPKDPIFEIEVTAEVVDEDEMFAEELSRILKRIRNTTIDEAENQLPDFIPFVVEDMDAGSGITDELSQEMENADPIVETTTGAKEDVKDSPDEELEIKLPWEDHTEQPHPLIAGAEINNIDLDFEEVQGTTPTTATGRKKDDTIAFDVNSLLEERVSIFNELFRTCDTESKLILMDEILAVGDERDLKFLETLAEDGNRLVRKKAEKISGELKAILESAEADRYPGINDQKDKLSENKTDEPQRLDQQAEGPVEVQEFPESAASDDLFDIDFELAVAQTDSDGPHDVEDPEMLETTSAGTGILGEILAIPSKLLNKLNG